MIANSFRCVNRGLAARLALTATLASAIAAATAAGCATSPTYSVAGGVLCPATQTLCGDVCADFVKDPANCGACGSVCKSGEVCATGKCATSCAGGTVACGQSCTIVAIDPQNCGACGTKCAAAQVCAAGKCANTCAASESICGGLCVDLMADRANCGVCATACAAGQVCAGGKCGLSCQAGLKLCTGPDPSDSGVMSDAAAPIAYPYCAQIQTDGANCGGCGITCGPGSICAGGVCTVSCQPSEITCSPDGGVTYCASPKSDNLNCGACGVICSGKTPVCSAGVCTAIPVSTGCSLPSVVSTITLDLQLSGIHSNFHPQGMAFDPLLGQFVLALQGPSNLWRVTTAGAVNAKVALLSSGQNSFNYMTAIATDANSFYISDYTCNNGCPDFFKVAKVGGSPAQISTDIAAYGGYPVAIGNNSALYRGNIVNNTYDWTGVTQIRVSNLASVDTITATLTPGIAQGIGDLTWDGNALWALGYCKDATPNCAANLFKIDPLTGSIIESNKAVYMPSGNLIPAGLAYDSGYLYVLNYSETSNVAGTITKLLCK